MGTMRLIAAITVLGLSLAATRAEDTAALALNYQNPIKEVAKYDTNGATMEQKLVSRTTYQKSLDLSKSQSLKRCQEMYTGEAFITCQNKVEYAYIVLENLPNMMDRMDFQGATSTELKERTDKETRKIAFTLVKSAFNSQPNND